MTIAGNAPVVGDEAAGASSAAAPLQLDLYRLAIGHYYSRALALIVKLGVADLLSEGPRSAAALATATGMHAPSLRRVLRLLTSVGVFDEQENGDFALTEAGVRLRSDVPGSMRASVQLFCGSGRVLASWNELEYGVRTGAPAFRARGLTDSMAWGETEEDPDEAANFDAAMAELTRPMAVAVASAYDFSAFETLVDVGGGNGIFTVGILTAHPDLTAIVCDRPDVVERARDDIARSGVADRVRLEACDFFTAVPTGGDAYVLKHVIHGCDDTSAIRVLSNCRRVMAPDGRLLIVEGVYPERIDESPESRFAAANDVNMLVVTGGRQRTEVEFAALLAASGFRLHGVTPTRSPVSVIEGRIA